MVDKTVTRAKLSDALHQRLGISRQNSADLVDQLLEEMIQGIIKDQQLKIASFGTFSVRKKRERMGRNPKTKESAVISARKVLSFKPSLMLKVKVND